MCHAIFTFTVEVVGSGYARIRCKEESILILLGKEGQPEFFGRIGEARRIFCSIVFIRIHKRASYG